MSNDSTSDESRLLRLLVLVLASIALVACVLAVGSARQRLGAAAEVTDFGPGSYDTLVTAPLDPPAFSTTSIWSLPSSRFVVFGSSAGMPLSRFATNTTGGLFGLELDGELVALSLVPPGLGQNLTELFIGPHSTVLAVAGMHPEMTAGDDQTQLARLARLAHHPAIDELARSVDGSTPLSQWGTQHREALAQAVADVVTSGSGAAGCGDSQPIAGSVSRCGTKVNNAGTSSVLMANQEGKPCALLAPATEDLTEVGRSALIELLTNGVPPSTQEQPLALLTASSADIDAQCGTASQVVVDPELNGEWNATSDGYVGWADDTLPMARILGAQAQVVTVDRSIESIVTPRGSASGSATIAERVARTYAYLSSPSTASKLGLLPLPKEAVVGLNRVTEILSEIYS